MDIFRQLDTEQASLVGWGVRVLLLAPDAEEPGNRTTIRLLGLGSRVETETDLYSAIDMVIGDPTGFGLFVMDCDAYGGFDAGETAAGLIARSHPNMRVILLSKDCPEQVFPDDPRQPIRLRAPLSAVALRVGFEHALRERLVYQAA